MSIVTMALMFPAPVVPVAPEFMAGLPEVNRRLTGALADIGAAAIPTAFHDGLPPLRPNHRLGVLVTVGALPHQYGTSVIETTLLAKSSVICQPPPASLGSQYIAADVEFCENPPP